jgi:hypothetical protein
LLAQRSTLVRAAALVPEIAQKLAASQAHNNADADAEAAPIDWSATDDGDDDDDDNNNDDVATPMSVETDQKPPIVVTPRLFVVVVVGVFVVVTDDSWQLLVMAMTRKPSAMLVCITKVESHSLVTFFLML